MTGNAKIAHAFHSNPPPEWALRHRKSPPQMLWDLIGAPLRMVVLPDYQSERFGFTSLRAERLRMVLPELRGRVLDVGCGDNMLLRLYREKNRSSAATESVGADVTAWSDDVMLIENAAHFSFDDASFDTVSYIACLNHIPERVEAIQEAARLLRPGGRVVATMIGSFVGKIGHALWWYSEDKEREMHPDELMGMDTNDVVSLFERAGLKLTLHKRFGYGLNNLFVAEKL
ncbi:class I SAM-dependent methyltransferase [Shinella oryzae]|uniref:class I SAM-dependent methyltransferase n=1 Tax=Shinella oryzae TaxID=2871820 RepID=UPI001FF1C96A|nr:methyltransferase domain-containing protein [Shinella oryzae]UPA25214.1 methyltransferase domain-containing protein [Shinella oryzae]